MEIERVMKPHELSEKKFTKKELVEMWKRPVERQYNIALTKMMECINETKGDITLCISGGKDSSLLADMYCDLISQSPYKDIPVKLAFANTTNETSAILNHVYGTIDYLIDKYGVSIDFQEVKPPNNLTWAKFVLENGLPLISKTQAKAIRYIKRDMARTGCDYETVLKYANQTMKSVNELRDIGFSDSGIISLTGYRTSKGEFGKMFMASKIWLPMANCSEDITEQCCVKIKEAALNSLPGTNVMSGEQASESRMRESVYLKTGCNIRLPNGEYKSKPFGAMTKDGILFALKYRGTPICSDYGEIVKDENGCYRCTKAQRTGCALCGFGCQYDTERFVRLQETEPAKVNFAFKPKSQGGAGYKEAIEYMNEYCGTKVVIPEV